MPGLVEVIAAVPWAAGHRCRRSVERDMSRIGLGLAHAHQGLLVMKNLEPPVQNCPPGKCSGRTEVDRSSNPGSSWVVPSRRKRTGAFEPKDCRRLYAENALAPSRRKFTARGRELRPVLGCAEQAFHKGSYHRLRAGTRIRGRDAQPMQHSSAVVALSVAPLSPCSIGLTARA